MTFETRSKVFIGRHTILVDHVVKHIFSVFGSVAISIISVLAFLRSAGHGNFANPAIKLADIPVAS